MKHFVYYILGALVAGIILLVVIQVNSYKIIDRLVDGNQQVSEVFRLEKKLFDLRLDIASLEDKVDSILQRKDQARLSGMKIELVIEHDLTELRQMDTTGSAVPYIDQLDRIVHRKIDISNQILDTFYASGNAGLAQLMEAGPSARLTDSITFVSHQFEGSRHELLERLTGMIDRSGAKAKRLYNILTILILLGGVGCTLFIISWIKRQNRLIDELHDSRVKEKESAAIKEKFMANMSHEIRTPLNAILGFTQLLQQKRLDTESSGYLRSIRQSGDDLLAIVNDILDLSKIEAGMMRIESYPFEIYPLVESIQALFARRIESKGLSFVVQVDDTIPERLEGDPSRLTQILVNLIDNAIKFTASGQITLRVRNENEEGALGFEVEDTGIGIARHKLDSVFDRFQQAEDSINRRFGGTGLGLSIVAELVALQGGHIGVDSEEGKGSRFYLQIPYKPAAAPPPPKPAASTGGLHRLRVLVVEDNDVNRLLMAGILGNEGMTYDLAESGQMAIGLLRIHTYQLVLMDIQMPGMDGYATTRAIRQELGLAVPIIAMTAHAFGGEREKCLSQGMNGYISKPIKVEALYALIQEVAAPPPYHHIRLDYMQGISRGNTQYEEKVSGQFIDGITKDLAGLSEAAARGDRARIQKIAHNMKTTISIMGLEEPFGSLLDQLENDAEADYADIIRQLVPLCAEAADEVRHFLTLLSQRGTGI